MRLDVSEEQQSREAVRVRMHGVCFKDLVCEDHARGEGLDGEDLQLASHARVAEVMDDLHISQLPRVQAILQEPRFPRSQSDAVRHHVHLAARQDEPVELLKHVPDVPPPAAEQDLLPLRVRRDRARGLAEVDVEGVLWLVRVVVFRDDNDLVARDEDAVRRGAELDGAVGATDPDRDRRRKPFRELAKPLAHQLRPRRHVELVALETQESLEHLGEARLPHGHEHQPADDVVRDDGFDGGAADEFDQRLVVYVADLRDDVPGAGGAHGADGEERAEREGVRVVGVARVGEDDDGASLIHADLLKVAHYQRRAAAEDDPSASSQLRRQLQHQLALHLLLWLRP
mmetsp:Transcript_23613/g.58871  ORF Transcript_23613/g.58871 Transcript_23613/m.58871 type:complete len:343 (+) Transcript_23613:1078-2106(+)